MDNLYPKDIYDIEIKTKRKEMKKRFRKTTNLFTIDNNNNRLKRKLNISNIKGKTIIKEFYVAYEFEKIKLIKYLHDMSTHRGINTL